MSINGWEDCQNTPNKWQHMHAIFVIALKIHYFFFHSVLFCLIAWHFDNIHFIAAWDVSRLENSGFRWQPIYLLHTENLCDAGLVPPEFTNWIQNVKLFERRIQFDEPFLTLYFFYKFHYVWAFNITHMDVRLNAFS